MENDKTFIENAVNSEALSKLIDDAAPFKVKIDVDYKREEKEIRDMFIHQIVKSDHKLQEILAKKRKNWNEDETIYAKTALANAKNKYNQVKKIIYPNNGKSPNEVVEKLVKRIVDVAGFLKFIDKNYIEEEFRKHGIEVSFPTPDCENEYFKKEGIKEVIEDIFNQAGEVNNRVQEANVEIKETKYNEIPSDIRYDSQMNKKGIKVAQFSKLVKTKAVALEKSMEQYTKFKENQVKNSEANLVSKQIEVEKLKEM